MCVEDRGTEAQTNQRPLSKYAKPYPKRLDVVKDRTRVKVFASLGNWLQEFRLYARDIDGKVIKANDHAMDATRYLIVSGLSRMKTKPADDPVECRAFYVGHPNQWMV